MASTPNLNIDLMGDGQINAHAKFNAAMNRIDTAAGTLTVLDSAPPAAPPGNPQEGATYVVPSSPTGLWSSLTANYLVEYRGGSWNSWQPINGTLVFDEKAQKTLMYHRGQNKWVAHQFANTFDAACADLSEVDANFAILVQLFRDIGILAPATVIKKISDQTEMVVESKNHVLNP